MGLHRFSGTPEPRGCVFVEMVIVPVVRIGHKARPCWPRYGVFTAHGGVLGERDANQSGMKATRRNRCLSLCSVILILGSMPAGAISLPNPERPFQEKTCDSAMRRLKEARAGSPLMPPKRNRELAAEAQRHAKAVCAGEGRVVPDP